MPDTPLSDRRKRLAAEILLVGVTAVWGWTFVMVKDAVALLPPLPFLAIRFGVATIVMGLGTWAMRARRSGRRGSAARAAAGVHGFRASVAAGRGLRDSVAAGLLMGTFLGLGYIFQTFGLQRTTASNAGFITGTFVVLVPVLQGLVWRIWPDLRAVLGVGLAAVGLFLLSGGSTELHLLGDGLVLLCAISFSAHILATSRYARRHDAAILTVVQLAVVTALCGVLALGAWALGEPLSLEAVWEPSVLVALGVTALFASAAAFYIQTFAQKHASSTRTAVILTMEPVFAGLFGYALAGERLSLAGWAGAAAILCGMLVSELRMEWPRRRSRE
ncbi:MAG TPA: DMT family transporter [Thermoleophilia bacterium]|nr:DMT family transporter [Thermoleophilia bacterium]